MLSSQWSPAWTLSSALTAVIALLDAPEPDSPLNVDAGKLHNNEKRLYSSSLFQSSWYLISLLSLYKPPFSGHKIEWPINPCAEWISSSGPHNHHRHLHPIDIGVIQYKAFISPRISIETTCTLAPLSFFSNPMFFSFFRTFFFFRDVQSISSYYPPFPLPSLTSSCSNGYRDR